MSLFFVRYVGGGMDGLTKGKVYLGRPCFDDGEAVDLAAIFVRDDSGEQLEFVTGDARFMCMDKVYAVVLEDCPAGRRGTVVEVDEATDDGMLVVCGRAARERYFEILDESNLAPGCWALDLRDNVWKEVRAVNDVGWLRVDGTGFRSPTSFVLPVSETGLMAEPWKRCVNGDGEDRRLTVGKAYRMVGWNRRKGMVRVLDDEGDETWFLADRFDDEV